MLKLKPQLAPLLSLLIVSAATILVVNAQEKKGHDDLPQRGVCVLVPKSESQVRGQIRFTQHEGYCMVTGQVRGLTPGEHGFHIHEFGDITDPKGMSTGGHFNPKGHMHGGLNAKESHVGDLGNITADSEGVAKVNIKAEGLQLHFVLGRGVVVHEKADDLTTQPTGNAGGRVAVGVIAIAGPPATDAKKK